MPAQAFAPQTKETDTTWSMEWPSQHLPVDSGMQCIHCQWLVAPQKSKNKRWKPCLHVLLVVVPRAATLMHPSNYGKKGPGECAEAHELQASFCSSPFLCSCPLPKGETSTFCEECTHAMSHSRCACNRPSVYVCELLHVLYIYIYIYIYVCVCVCVYPRVFRQCIILCRVRRCMATCFVNAAFQALLWIVTILLDTLTISIAKHHHCRPCRCHHRHRSHYYRHCHRASISNGRLAASELQHPCMHGGFRHCRVHTVRSVGTSRSMGQPLAAHVLESEWTTSTHAWGLQMLCPCSANRCMCVATSIAMGQPLAAHVLKSEWTASMHNASHGP